jgi:tripartite-type tricarboxylate transporter receptor subunit TctC
MHLNLRLAFMALASALTVTVAPAGAQQYPSQPIKIIVSLAPGGVADIVARIFANKMGEAGKTFIVENRTGGSGIIGADAVAKSAPDGYTLYMGFHGTQSILPHLMAKLPYDATKDFLPVIFIATSPNILIVHPSVPAKTPAELVAYIKANPGKVTYASPGVGSSGHVAAEQFKQLHGLDITPVHYRGAAPALQDVVAGHTSMMFDIVPLTKEQLAAGRVRALAITSKQRGAAVPDVPTMVEAGMPEVQGGPWFGLFAPAGTPRPVIEWINAEANKVFSMPDVRERLTGQGLSLPLGSPEDFGKHVADETTRWGEVIRRANIKLE